MLLNSVLRPVLRPVMSGVMDVLGVRRASMPAGALGIWYADQYSAANHNVPNAVAATQPTTNILRAPRRLNSAAYYQTDSATLTPNAAVGPDSLTEAYTLTSSGNGWYMIPDANPATGAGTFTLGYWVKRNTGTDQTFGMGFNNNGGSVVSKTATASWARVSVTQTLSATSNLLWLCKDINGTTPANIQICDIGLFPGAVDLGAEVPAGHLYLGSTSKDVKPAYATGELDLSTGGYGLIQFPSFSASAITVSALLSKVAAGSAYQGFMSKVQDYTAFSAMTEEGGRIQSYFNTGDLAMGGATVPLLNAGYHVVTMKYDGTTLEWWLDDFRFARKALVKTAVSLADLWVGLIDSTGLPAGFKLSCLALYPSALTKAQILNVVSVFQARAAASSLTAASATRVVYTEGDSISSNTGAWPYLLTPNLSPAAFVGIGAIGGSTLATMAARASTLDADLPTLGSRTAILTVLIGANDLHTYPGASDAIAAASYIAALASYCDARRASGWKVAVCTILPRTAAAAHNARRAIVNADIVANWVGVHCTSVIDFAANTNMGPDAAAANATYYSDGIHPTAAGYAVLETIARPIINAL